MSMSLALEPNAKQGKGTMPDMRKSDEAETLYLHHVLKLSSDAPFSVECCGQTKLHSTFRNGKHRLHVAARTNIGEIEGRKPVYESK